MGLSVSHDCWEGAYPSFNRWRAELARLVGIPLELMEGFYRYDPALYVNDAAALRNCCDAFTDRDGTRHADADLESSILARYARSVHALLPLRWDVLQPDPLFVLLDHSDCDGWLPVESLIPLADRLAALLPLLPTTPDPGHIGDWRTKTERFIAGLRLAAERGEEVEFG